MIANDTFSCCPNCRPYIPLHATPDGTKCPGCGWTATTKQLNEMAEKETDSGTT